MRVMVLVKATERSEAGEMPSMDELNAMGKFNAELVEAGIMLAGEGLRESSHGKRVRFGDDKSATVLDGPFAETKELVSGFWVWEVASMDEAMEWLKRAPLVDTTVEVRPVFEAEDFGDNFTPEMQAEEQKLRDRMESQHGA
ncbi:MAG: YciI family protein [Jatrophihabitans sp.]